MRSPLAHVAQESLRGKPGPNRAGAQRPPPAASIARSASSRRPSRRLFGPDARAQHCSGAPCLPCVFPAAFSCGLAEHATQILPSLDERVRDAAASICRSVTSRFDALRPYPNDTVDPRRPPDHPAPLQLRYLTFFGINIVAIPVLLEASCAARGTSSRPTFGVSRSPCSTHLDRGSVVGWLAQRSMSARASSWAAVPWRYTRSRDLAPFNDPTPGLIPEPRT